MDVSIGNDSPPAPPAGSASAPPAGSTSAPLAGSTSSSLPQEDQAQGAGDDADHPVDVDSSPHNQSADVSDGDGARPLREPAEERETPRTPTSAAGGAGGQGPEANGRTPTVSLSSVVCAFHGLSLIHI